MSIFKVNLELEYLESVLNYFFTSLHKNKILDCTNIIILSDHGIVYSFKNINFLGMQFLNKRYYFNELIDTTGMILTSGVIGRAHMANSSNDKSDII